MTSVIRDPMFDLTLARWECVGSCSCDDNRGRDYGQAYQEKRERYPVEPSIGQPDWKPKRFVDPEPEPDPKVG